MQQQQLFLEKETWRLGDSVMKEIFTEYFVGFKFYTTGLCILKKEKDGIESFDFGSST